MILEFFDNNDEYVIFNILNCLENFIKYLNVKK
jgi:hypothetical protein